MGARPENREQGVILDSIADGVFTVDDKWRITLFNRAAERITGVPRDEAIGRLCCDVFRASICESECALRQTLETGRSIVAKPIYIVNVDGQRIPDQCFYRDLEGSRRTGHRGRRDIP